jgi:hypothetical protein
LSTTRQPHAMLPSPPPNSVTPKGVEHGAQAVAYAAHATPPNSVTPRQWPTRQQRVRMESERVTG